MRVLGWLLKEHLNKKQIDMMQRKICNEQRLNKQIHTNAELSKLKKLEEFTND